MYLPEVACILIGLAAYQLLNRLLRVIVKRHRPSFYASLESNRSRKLAPYFVFPVGILATLISTPACTLAYATTSPATDTFGTQRPFTTSGKVCFASRAMLWVSELPLLRYSPEYLTHHILALGSIVIILLRGMPRRPFYLIFAGLVTELFSNVVAILRLHGRNVTNSTVFRGAMVANAQSMVFLRITPILVFLARMDQTSPDLLGGVAMYCAYLIRLTLLQLKTLGFIESMPQELFQSLLFGKHVKPVAANWLPRPMALAVCGALAIATFAGWEYVRTQSTFADAMGNS